MSKTRSFLQTIGSLWIGAILIALLLFAMACATAHESVQGSEHALAVFYHSWWFLVLLGVVGLTSLASVASRWPFKRREIGFVCTHVGLAIVLIGSCVTWFAVERGQLILKEGQTSDVFSVEGQDLIELGVDHGPVRASRDLSEALASPFKVVEFGAGPEVSIDGVTARVLKYLPDSEFRLTIHDDSPAPRLVMEVAGISNGERHEDALVPGSVTNIEGVQVSLRTVAGSPVR